MIRQTGMDLATRYPMRITRHLGLAALLIGVLTTLRPPAALADTGNNRLNSAVCRQAIEDAEEGRRLPFGILQAISLAESGRWNKETREKYAWPWTVTAHGEGKFYPTRAAAIAAVKRLKADGVRNIDVGCMQINLYYHPEAFDSLEEAFDPAANSLYAAELLSRLRKAHRSLTRAVAYYHSSTRERNLPYKRKVMRLWSEERRRHYEEARKRARERWQIGIRRNGQ